MTAERPYFSASIGELENVFAAGKEDADVLKKLAAELKCRKRPRAKKLREEVMNALARACAKNAVTACASKPAGCRKIVLEKLAQQCEPPEESAPEVAASISANKKGFWRRLFIEKMFS